MAGTSEVKGMKLFSDAVLFVLIGIVPYLLAWSRLNGQRAKQVLYEAARYNPGIRA